MKILVTGYTGQLGHDVGKRLEQNSNNIVLAVGQEEMEITDKLSVEKILFSFCPDVIVHCAAYTAVDKAEEDNANCNNVNVQGTANVVKAAKVINAKIVYISTDYVFNGEKKSPYETYDNPDPQSVYGMTKFLGEKEVQKHDKHFIIRISWVFGINGSNFVKSIIKKAKSSKEIFVVSDQMGSPTYTKDLAVLIENIIKTEKYGIYHATNEGYCSWHEFAIFFLSQANISTIVKPISSKEYKTFAKRPLNSMLSKKSLDDEGFERLPSWEDAVIRYLKELGEYKI